MLTVSEPTLARFIVTIKQFTTGKGNAPKDAMIKAMQALGHAPADDNEADALALLHWAIKHHKGDLNHG
jgi:Holliday junction resolvasome RuvABC endonuclease subunit